MFSFLDQWSTCLKIEIKFQPSATEMDPSMREGSAVLSFVWFEVAKRVVETAIRVYELTPEQIVAVKKVFLRAGDYVVESFAE